jgi:hypothetical protein
MPSVGMQCGLSQAANPQLEASHMSENAYGTIVQSGESL